MMFRKNVFVFFLCCLTNPIIPMQCHCERCKIERDEITILSKQEKALLGDVEVELKNGGKVKYRKYISEFKKLRSFISNRDNGNANLKDRMDAAVYLYKACCEMNFSIKRSHPQSYKILRDYEFISSSGEIVSNIVKDMMIRFADYNSFNNTVVLYYPDFSS